MVEIVVNGRRGEKVVPLPDDRALIIGRRGKLRINDRRISRQHARVLRRDDAWYVEDLGSKNGTYINHVRVTNTEPVHPGDTIKIGNTTLIIRQAAPRGDNATAALVPVRGRNTIDVPALTREDEASLALDSRDEEVGVASRRWGPVLLCGMMLALVVSVLFTAIAYVRTRAALRDLEVSLHQRAEQRDLELVAALRGDLQKASSPAPAELAALLERAAQRGEAQSAAHAQGIADQVEERFAQLQRATHEELIELRRTLDGLNRKLEAPPPSPPLQAAAPSAPPSVEFAPPAPAAPLAETPAVAPIAAAAPAATAAPAPPDVVFLIDVSRGLRSSLPQVLAQVRLAMNDLPSPQHCRILVAQETRVLEILGGPLESSPLDDLTASSNDSALAPGTAATHAVALALKMQPRTLHLLTDSSGDNAANLRKLLRSRSSGVPAINITHFHTRELREDLKAIARDHGGIYAFIGPS